MVCSGDRQSARPHPWRHRAPDDGVDHAGRPQPHGRPRRPNLRAFPIPHPRTPNAARHSRRCSLRKASKRSRSHRAPQRATATPNGSSAASDPSAPAESSSTTNATPRPSSTSTPGTSTIIDRTRAAITAHPTTTRRPSSRPTLLEPSPWRYDQRVPTNRLSPVKRQVTRLHNSLARYRASATYSLTRGAVIDARHDNRPPSDTFCRPSASKRAPGGGPRLHDIHSPYLAMISVNAAV
jgi:hypothetical protein